MKSRFVAIVSAVTALLAVAGVSMAATSPTAVAGIQEHEIEAAGAGTVVVAVEGSSLTVVEATPNDGWIPEIEVVSGVEVEVDFRQSDATVQVKAELEDGELRVRVRERAATGAVVESTTTSTVAVGSSTTTTEPDTTSTTVATTSTTVAATTSTTSANGPTTTSTMSDNGTPLAPGQDTFVISGVGQVTVAWSGTVLTLVSYDVEAGWTAQVEIRPDRIEIEFVNGDREAEFKARLRTDGVEIDIESS